MRNALEEYNIEIEKALREVEKSTSEEKLISEYTSEDKRVSVPRKEAISERKDTTDADNNIKCTTSEDCHEQTYKMPSDIIDSHFAMLGNIYFTNNTWHYCQNSQVGDIFFAKTAKNGNI